MNEKHQGTVFQQKIFDLPKIFPPGTSFLKLRGKGAPYVCAEWKHDRNGDLCLYYEFSSSKKRIPISVIEAAVLYFKKEKIFNVEGFRKISPELSKIAPCNYAVIGRILEKCFDAKYAGSDGFFLQ